MSNAEHTLQLLWELERLDREADEGNDSPLPEVTPAALLKALVDSDFDLTAAILGVRSGA